MTSPIIDLSHWNPEPDWTAAKAGGVSVAILKCTQGTSYVDDTYGKRAKNAADAGVLTCPYHFLEKGNVAQQMAWFLARADPPDGGRLVIDHEPYNSGGKDRTPSLDELCQAVGYLQNEGRNLQVTVYSGSLIKEQLGSSSRRSELNDTSLWIAQYTSASAPSWPKQQWANWSIWQWTDKEDVPGVSAPVDGNRWNGSIDALVSFFSPAGGSAVTPPGPEPDYPSTITLIVPKGTIVWINEVEVVAA